MFLASQPQQAVLPCIHGNSLREISRGSFLTGSVRAGLCCHQMPCNQRQPSLLKFLLCLGTPPRPWQAQGGSSPLTRCGDRRGGRGTAAPRAAPRAARGSQRGSCRPPCAGPGGEGSIFQQEPFSPVEMGNFFSRPPNNTPNGRTLCGGILTGKHIFFLALKHSFSKINPKLQTRSVSLRFLGRYERAEAAQCPSEVTGYCWTPKTSC